MIRFTVHTAKKGCTLRLLLKASPTSNVVVRGYDKANDCMSYFRLEFEDYDHKGYLYCPMPLTPDKMTICISTTDGSKVEMTEPASIVALKTSPIPATYNTPKNLDLFRFVQNVAVMSYFVTPWHESNPDNLITSKGNANAGAQISYQIMEYDDNGKVTGVSTTPARVGRPINASEKDFILIEISQVKRRKMSVYMCVAMLLHELGHYILDTSDEMEADAFSRAIYFALGYPKSEYIYSFTDVFTPMKNADGSINEAHDMALGERLIAAEEDIAYRVQRYF